MRLGRDGMAKIRWEKQLEHYASQVAKLGNRSGEICGKATYEMAAIVADKIRKNLDGLHAEPDTEGLAAWKEKRKAQLTYSEKKGLQNSLGISKLEYDRGYYNVKIGFDGYNSVKTRKYPKGQPNVLIARAVESGSSVRDKQPFVRPAVNAARAEALKACERVVDREIKKIMK